MNSLVFLVVGLLFFSALLLYTGISNIIGAVTNKRSLPLNFSIRIFVGGLLILGLTLVFLATI